MRSSLTAGEEEAEGEEEEEEEEEVEVDRPKMLLNIAMNWRRWLSYSMGKHKRLNAQCQLIS